MVDKGAAVGEVLEVLADSAVLPSYQRHTSLVVVVVVVLLWTLCNLRSNAIENRVDGNVAAIADGVKGIVNRLFIACNEATGRIFAYICSSFHYNVFKNLCQR